MIRVILIIYAFLPGRFETVDHIEFHDMISCTRFQAELPYRLQTCSKCIQVK